MNPLAGTEKTDGTERSGLHGDVRKSAAKKTPKKTVSKTVEASTAIPALNLDKAKLPSATSRLEAVLPYFTPRGSYTTPRFSFEDASLDKLIDGQHEEWSFVSQKFEGEIRKTMGTYLKMAGCPSIR